MNISNYFSGCVRIVGFPETIQENLFKVFLRFPSTDLVQIAIAALSFVPLLPRRTLTVQRTFLIQRQKSFAKDVLIPLSFLKRIKKKHMCC